MDVEIIECITTDSEIEALKKKYGEPTIRKMDRNDVHDIHLPANTDYLNCVGEGVGVILNDRYQFALVKKARKESWFFPSGRIMKGESIENGIVREVHEETV